MSLNVALVSILINSPVVPTLGSNAVISLIFAEYLNRLFWHITQSDAPPDSIPQWSIQLVAIAAILLVTLVCVLTRSLGTKVAVVFTAVKVRSTLTDKVWFSRLIVQVLSLVRNSHHFDKLQLDLFHCRYQLPSSV